MVRTSHKETTLDNFCLNFVVENKPVMARCCSDTTDILYFGNSHQHTSTFAYKFSTILIKTGHGEMNNETGTMMNVTKLHSFYPNWTHFDWANEGQPNFWIFPMA